MRQDLWKPLLILIIVENFVLNEGRIKDSSEFNHEIDSKLHSGVEELCVKSAQKYEDKSNQKKIVRGSKFHQGEISPLLAHNKISVRLRQNIGGQGRNKRKTEINVQNGYNPEPLYEQSTAKYKIHVLDPYEVNEKAIREITGAKKVEEIPHCTRLEYNSIEKWNYMPQEEHDSIQRTPDSNQEYRKRELKNISPVKKIRSKWKLHIHENDLKNEQSYNFKTKVPSEYLKIKKDEEFNYSRNLENKAPLYSVQAAKSMNEFPKNHLGGKDNSLLVGQGQYVSENEKIKSKENMSVENTSINSPDFDKKTLEANLTRIPINQFENRLYEGNTKTLLKKSSLMQNENKNIEGNTDFASSKEIKTTNTLNSFNKLDNLNVLTPVSHILNNKINSEKSSELKGFLLKQDGDVQNQNVLQIPNFSQQKLNKGIENQMQTACNQYSDIHLDDLHKNVKYKSSEKDLPETLQGSGSHICSQPIPLSNSFATQKVASPIESQQNAEDIVTINAKTVENKVFPADFLKKSEDMKTSGTLRIEELHLGNTFEAKENLTPDLSNGKFALSTSNNNKIAQLTQFNQESENSNPTNINGQISKAGNFIKKESNVMFDQHFSPLQDRRSSKKLEIPQINNNPNAKVSNAVKINERSNRQFQRSIPQRKINSVKKAGSFKITYNDESGSKADGASSNVVMSQMREGFDESDESLNNAPKVIVIQTKQGCPSNIGCVQTPKLVHCADANCIKTTPCKDNFKELLEGYREDDLAEFNDLYKVNPKWLEECSTIPDSRPYNCPNSPEALSTYCPSCMTKDFKREIKDEFLSNLNPIVVIQTSNGDKETEERRTRGSSIDKEIVNFRDESGLSFEKGNKKVENKILEGFINSIIANYSKDETKASTKEPLESIDKPEDEAVIRLIKDFTNKKNVEGPENFHLQPIIIPESSVPKYKDLIEYSKLGPYNEAELKSLLQNNQIQLVLKENVERRRAIK